MRASTVFAIALSLLVGLAAAATAKYAGLFNKKEVAAPPPPPPVKVLVPRVNLYKDLTVTADQVMVMDLSPEQQKQYADQFGADWQRRLMPAMPSIAHLRITKKAIPAGQPLFRDDLEDPDLPDALSRQIEPGMRAVNVSLLKDRAGGGQIRKGELVDVLMTTKVAVGGREELRTAVIARACKVVMKRNTLFTIVVADPDDKPLHFTLQANPYRAALIEYAQTHGQLSLMPVPSGAAAPEATSGEFAADRQRSEAIVRGELTISDADLRRIFNIVPPAPRVQPVVIQHYSGVKDAGRTVIVDPPTGPMPSTGTSNKPYSEQGSGVQPAGGIPQNTGVADDGYNFRLPNATGPGECKECEENKRKQQEAAKYRTVQPN